MPRVRGDGLTVRDLVNRFLTSKRHLLDTAEITQRTFRAYYASCETLVSAFGRDRLVDDLAIDDFESLRSHLAKPRGPVALGNEIRHVRMVFKYGYEAGLIDRPVRFGPTFKMPSRKVLRQARQANGLRMFEADELRTILETACQPLRSMIFLGVNCGFGQTDVSNLPRSAVDLAAGWIDYPRPKTAIPRRCPLWPETVETLRGAIAFCPKPKVEADADLVFVTKYGHRWVRSTENGTQVDAVASQFSKLLRDLGLKRPKLNFYALRHTFETIAGESRDQVAVDHIMGHARDDMASVYRERISDERLTTVTSFVRDWLLGPTRL